MTTVDVRHHGALAAGNRVVVKPDEHTRGGRESKPYDILLSPADD